MTTLNLPYKRWVAQVTTGEPRSKSTYLALMAENLTALQACPWRAAADVPVSLTGHDFSASYLSDAFDAYKMTGNYDTATMTEIGYAGMAAYRFKIPASAQVSGAEVAATAIDLPLSRDRFLLGGVHVGVELTDRETPAEDWATVRGTGSLAQTALSQSTVAYLLAGDVGSETLTIDLSEVADNPQPYLWVYLTLEDYTDAWEMYDKKEMRLYAIEGSAMLVGGSASVVFDGDVTPDGPTASLPVVAGGILPRLMGDVSGVFATVRRGDGDGVAFEDAPPDASGEDGGMGLHSLYADLLLGRLQSVPTSAMPGAARPGVGFALTRGTMSVPGSTQGTDVVAPVWKLALSVLVVPFVRPGGRFSLLSLEWTAPDPAAGTIRAYLAPGQYIEQPSAADLSAPAFFTGDDNLPEGWQPLGEFAASAGSATLALPAPPPVPQLATLLLAAWLPQAAVDPSSSAAQGVGALAYDPFTGELSGLSSLVVPTITLI